MTVLPDLSCRSRALCDLTLASSEPLLAEETGQAEPDKMRLRRGPIVALILGLSLLYGARAQTSTAADDTSTAAPSSSVGTTSTIHASFNATGPCYTNPTAAQCATFKRADAEWTSDVASLCSAMSFMSGCTLWKQCKAGQASGDFCTPASLAADLCVDMPRMKGCEAYTALCARGTKVAQCTTPGPVPDLVTTYPAKEAVDAICTSMSMTDCASCSETGLKFAKCPDPLGTLSALCIAMPGMGECASFQQMCATDAVESSFSSLCSGQNTDGSQSLPPMKMWMHASTREIFLFKEWVPSTTGAYIGACIGCLLFAVFTQGLKAVRLWMEVLWSHQWRQECMCNQKASPKSSCCELPTVSVISRPQRTPWEIRLRGKTLINANQVWRNSMRSVFTFVAVLFEYMLMLLVMTFNIGIIISTVLGFAIGTLLFGHVGEAAQGAVIAEVLETLGQVEPAFSEGAGCCGSAAACSGV